MCKKAVIWHWEEAWRCPILELVDDERLAELRRMKERREIGFYGNVFALDNPKELVRLGAAMQSCWLPLKDELLEAIDDIYSSQLQ